MRSTGVFSWPSCGFTLPSCKGLVVLSKVFVVRYYRVVCSYYWRCSSASRKVPLMNKMAEQSEVQWLDGQAKDGISVEKICPKRHIRQNQWQSEWNEMYLKYGSKHCYDYISDYECVFNHPVYPYFDDRRSWNTLQQFKHQGTEMRITNLAHFTRPGYAEAIIESGGFVGDFKKINKDAQGDDILAKFSWWSPVFTENDNIRVRDTLEDILKPFMIDRRDSLNTLMAQFATSYAFRPDPERYGSSYFKYDIDELCDHYAKHFKGEVQFKVLGTFGYKQEVMHAVLVCSQANAAGMFRAYPNLPSSSESTEDVVSGWGFWIWRPQATGTEITRLCRYWQPYPMYRRWENVAFAFHIPDEWAENDKRMVIPGLHDHLHDLEEEQKLKSERESSVYCYTR